MCSVGSCVLLRAQFQYKYLWLQYTQQHLFGTAQFGRFRELYIIYRALWVIWWLTVFTWDLIENEIGSRWLAYFSNWSYTLLLVCCLLQLVISLHTYVINSKCRKSCSDNRFQHLLEIKQEEGSLSNGVEKLTVNCSIIEFSSNNGDLPDSKPSKTHNNITETNSAHLLETKQGKKSISSGSEKSTLNSSITKDSSDASNLPIVYKFMWILYNISCNSALVITAIFWGQFVLIVIAESQTSLFINISVHLINSVYVITDLLVSAIPIRILHFWFSFLLGASYAFYSIIYAVEGSGELVYPALDWNKHSPAVLGLVVCMCVASAMAHLFMFALYSIRMSLYSYCNR